MVYFNALCLIGALCQCANLWYLSQLRVLAAIPWLLAAYVCYAVVELVLWLQHPDQYGLLGFVALDLFATVSAARGLMLASAADRPRGTHVQLSPRGGPQGVLPRSNVCRTCCPRQK